VSKGYESYNMTHIKELLHLACSFVVQVKDMVRILNCFLVRHFRAFLIPSQDNPVIIENNVRLEARISSQALDQVVYFVSLLRL